MPSTAALAGGSRIASAEASASGMTGQIETRGYSAFTTRQSILSRLSSPQALAGRRRVEARIARAKKRLLPLLDRQRHGGARCQETARAFAHRGQLALGLGRALVRADLDLEGAARCSRGCGRCRSRRLWRGRAPGEAAPRSSRVPQPAARHAQAWRLAARRSRAVRRGQWRCPENSAGFSDGAAGGVGGARLAAVVHCGVGRRRRCCGFRRRRVALLRGQLGARSGRARRDEDRTHAGDLDGRRGWRRQLRRGRLGRRCRGGGWRGGRDRFPRWARNALGRRHGGDLVARRGSWRLGDQRRRRLARLLVGGLHQAHVEERAHGGVARTRRWRRRRPRRSHASCRAAPMPPG